MKRCLFASPVDAPLVIRTLQTGFASLCMLAGGVAAAQDASAWNVHPALQDRWSFQIGAYRPEVDTDAYLNGSDDRVNASVSFEDDLNLKDRDTMPTFQAAVRLGQRWRIEAEYFSLKRSSSNTLKGTIEWGDNTYPVGGVVNGRFDSTIYRLSAGYSLVKDNQKELGVALGLHVTDFEASIGAERIGTTARDTLAPLPTIGLYGAYAFTPRWLLSGRVDYFSLKYRDYDGSLANAQVGVDYRLARNFGIGAGYRYVDYDLTVEKSSYNGGINYTFSGPFVYAVASF